MESTIDNPFVDPEIASNYEEWYTNEGLKDDRLEKNLLKKLINIFPQSQTILDVGCGTAHFTKWFSEQGLRATGIDISRNMLAEAHRNGKYDCICGDALALPFPSSSFDLVALITTLEFLPDSLKAITESLRVAKLGLVIGALNKNSILGRGLKKKGGPIWGSARLFTNKELICLLRRAASDGHVKIIWRTTLWPLVSCALPLPWGGFIGMIGKKLEKDGG